MLIYYVYCVYSGFAEAHEKKQQQQLPPHLPPPPLCINYNNPTSREREKKKIHAEIKAEWPGVITYQKVEKKKHNFLSHSSGQGVSNVQSPCANLSRLEGNRFSLPSTAHLNAILLLSIYTQLQLISARTTRRGDNMVRCYI